MSTVRELVGTSAHQERLLIELYPSLLKLAHRPLMRLAVSDLANGRVNEFASLALQMPSPPPEHQADVIALSKVRALARTGSARAIRQAAAISLSELASELGVEASTLSRWERGLRTPRGAAAMRYAQILDALSAATHDPDRR